MLEEAVSYYSFNSADAQLLRHNENMTYKISRDQKTYLMRIHKPIQGFNLDLIRMGGNHHKQIEDEIKILEYLDSNSDLGTQKVVKNIFGQNVTLLNDGTPVTVLEWIEGRTLENVEMTNQIAFSLGMMLGKLHKALSFLKLSDRYNYNDVLLSQMIIECAEAHSKKHFGDKQATIIDGTLHYIRDYFIHNKDSLLLVHSDLGKSNMLFANEKIVPIDFSLSGYSVPEMDLASVFSHINNNLFNSEILKGYHAVNENIINEKAINICLCFQILLFVICQHNVVAAEPWFSDKLNQWCEEQFIPLISNKSISVDIGLYA